jgi:membrane protease YdiL (CAAX protease family)
VVLAPSIRGRGALLSPVIEETLARYLLLRVVERLAGTWAAVAVTALLADAGHRPAENPAA